MELDEIKTLWKENNTKLNKSMNISMQGLSRIQSQKVKSNLRPLLWLRVIELLLHVLALLLFVVFLYNNFRLIPFAFSALILVALYGMLAAKSARQIQIIRSIGMEQSIVAIQSKMAILQTHSLNYMRMILLFLPAFLAYPMVVSKIIQDYDLSFLQFMDIQAKSQVDWWKVQAIGTLILTPISIWLYRIFDYRQVHTGWIKIVVEKIVGKHIARVSEYLKELDNLRKV